PVAWGPMRPRAKGPTPQILPHRSIGRGAEMFVDGEMSLHSAPQSSPNLSYSTQSFNYAPSPQTYEGASTPSISSSVGEDSSADRPPGGSAYSPRRYGKTSVLKRASELAGDAGARV